MVNTAHHIYSVSSLQKCIKFEPHPMSVEIRECLSSNIISLCFRREYPLTYSNSPKTNSIFHMKWGKGIVWLHSLNLKGGPALHCINQLFHSSPQRTTEFFPTHNSLSSLGIIQLSEPANHALHIQYTTVCNNPCSVAKLPKNCAMMISWVVMQSFLHSTWLCHTCYSALQNV